MQSVVADSPAAASGIVAGAFEYFVSGSIALIISLSPGTVICKVNGAILPCNRGSTAVFDSIKRGLEQGAASPAGITLTVIHPHSPFPFARSSEGSRSHSATQRAKLARSQGPESPSSGNAASSGDADAAFRNIGDIEMHQDTGKGTANISRGRALPSGAVDLTVKVSPLGLGFVPSKILVSSDFDCR